MILQIVSEERSGGSTNVKTAYPGWDRSGGGGSGSSPKGLMGGTPKGKYNWHTVVDGLSEYNIEPSTGIGKSTNPRFRE